MVRVIYTLSRQVLTYISNIFHIEYVKSIDIELLLFSRASSLCHTIQNSITILQKTINAGACGRCRVSDPRFFRPVLVPCELHRHILDKAVHQTPFNVLLDNSKHLLFSIEDGTFPS